MGCCPSAEQLRQLLAGKLGGSEWAHLESHLEACPACQGELARMSDDPELRRWRRLLDTAPTGIEADGEGDPFGSLLDSQPPEREGSGPEGERPGDASESSGPPRLRGRPERIGHYRIAGELGRGASGIVYRAHDERLDRTVALKVLRPELATTDSMRARFRREARAAVAVRYDHIVAVYDVGECPGLRMPYLALEYVEGESLAGRIRRAGSLPPREAAQIGRQVASGLEHAREAGLVHRDVKSSNILLEAATGRAKPTNFGIARLADAEDDASRDRLTGTGSFLGTPAYMSPEHIRTPRAVDPRSDVYGLGVVLYEALTGEVPFRGETTAVLQQVLTEEPRPLRAFDRRLPRDLETKVGKCLNKEPAWRYRTAGELAEDLGRWLDGRPILASPMGPGRRLVKWMRRRPALATALVFSIAATVALIAVIATSNAVLGSKGRELSRANTTLSRLNAELTRRGEQLERALRAEAEERERRETALLREGITSAGRLLREGRDAEAGSALALVPPSRRGWEWHWLQQRLRLGPRPVHSLPLHDGGALAPIPFNGA